MAVLPGNYTPDNWSSGYRIKTVDSADKRAELFNDFSYWMVRKFEIEIDTRHANDLNIIGLVNDATWNINQHAGYIGNLDNANKAINNTLNLHSGYIGNLDTRTVGQGKDLVNHNDRLVAAQIRMNGFDSSLNLHSGYIGNLDVRTIGQSKDLVNHNDRIVNNQSRLNGHDNVIKQQSEYISTLDATTQKHTAAFIADAILMANFQSRLGGHDDLLNQQAEYISNLDKLSKGYSADLINHNDRIVNNQNRLNEVEASVFFNNQAIDSLKNSVGNIESDIIYLSAVTGEADENLQNQITNMKIANAATDLLLLNSFSDLKESITLFNEYFYADANFYEDGINSSDGIFTKLVKGQFTRLIGELNRQLTLSLEATTDNIESFKTYLREEFALLNDWHSLQVEWSTLINENILVAIAALDKIALRPIGDVNVSVPIFDFDRLKEILDELSFGNVVNEAGTNLWDVLKELIETLGGVIEAVVGIVPDLIDKLIGLVIPENTEFLNDGINRIKNNFQVKFKSVTDLNTSFSSLYNQPKDLATMEIEIFEQKFNIFPANLKSTLTLVKSLVTGFMVLLTLLSAYKRIVGSGDVIQ